MNKLDVDVTDTLSVYKSRIEHALQRLGTLPSALDERSASLSKRDETIEIVIAHYHADITANRKTVVIDLE